ncbi:MAG: T9SS type A sorting domain-containing protein [Chitinophagales bacterium]
MKAQIQILHEEVFIMKANFPSALNNMKKKVILVLFLLIPLAPSFAQCDDWIDVSKNGYDQYGLAVDDEGNIYYGGQFFDSVTVGNHLIIADTILGPHSVFIAKVDSNGNLLWERHFTHTENLIGIFVPELAWSNGKLYVSGMYYGPLVDESGETLLVSPNYFSFYVMSLMDEDGQISASKSFATTNNGFVTYTGLYGITVGSNGKIFITGRFRDTVTFDTITLSSPGVRVTFIACLDGNLNTVWAKQSFHTTINTTSISRGYSIVTDNHFNVLIGGFTWKDIQFGNQLFTTNNDAGWNPYIAKFDSSGSCLWIRGGKGNGVFQNVYALDVNDNDEIFMSSPLEDTLSFNGTMLDAANGSLYLNKFDVNGNLLWSVQDGIDTNSVGYPLISDLFWKSGQVWCTGWGGISTGGNENFNGSVFALQFDENGNETSFFTTYGCSDSYHIVGDEKGNIYISGNLRSDSVSVGNIHFMSADTLRGPFLLKLCDVATVTQDITDNNSLLLFPNPAAEYFNVEIASAKETVHVYIADITGKNLQHKQISNRSGNVKLQFDVSTYPAGSYFVRVISNENSIVKQLQVVR